MAPFLPWPGFTDPIIKGTKREWYHSLLHQWLLAKCLLPVPTSLYSPGLEVLGQGEECFYWETQQWLHWTRISDSSLATLGSSCLWINQQVKEFLCCLGWLILPPRGHWTVPPQWREGRVCLESRRTLRASKDYQALWLKPMENFNTQPRQDSQRPRLFGNGDLDHLTSRETQPAEVLAEGKGNTERVMGEGSYKCQYGQMTRYRNEDCNCHEYFLLSLLGMCLCVCACVCMHVHACAWVYTYTLSKSLHFLPSLIALSCNIRRIDYFTVFKCC